MSKEKHSAVTKTYRVDVQTNAICYGGVYVDAESPEQAKSLAPQLVIKADKDGGFDWESEPVIEVEITDVIEVQEHSLLVQRTIENFTVAAAKKAERGLPPLSALPADLDFLAALGQQSIPLETEDAQ